MKELTLGLHANVGCSSEAVGQNMTTASAPTEGLPTIAVHPAATVLPLEPATSLFAAGIPPTIGSSTVLVSGAILLAF